MISEIKIKSCNLCGSSKFKFLFFSKDRMFNIPGQFTVKKCIECSLVFLDPQPSQDVLKKHYPSKKYYSYHRSKKKGLFEFVREYLVEHSYSPNVFSIFVSSFIQSVPAIPFYVKNGKLLDIGCGDGDTLTLLKKLGWKTYGLDIDAKAVEAAKQRKLNVKMGTFRELSSYPDNYFDVIRMYHVIEHIDDPSLCLSLISKKLKREGELLIGTPNVKSIIAGLFKAYWYNLDTPRHLFLFSPSILAKLLGKNNFQVNKVEFCSVGGIAGSLQYALRDLINTKTELVYNVVIILLLYPLEWLLNKLRVGDIFVVSSSIKSSIKVS